MAIAMVKPMAVAVAMAWGMALGIKKCPRKPAMVLGSPPLVARRRAAGALAAVLVSLGPGTFAVLTARVPRPLVLMPAESGRILGTHHGGSAASRDDAVVEGLFASRDAVNGLEGEGSISSSASSSPGVKATTPPPPTSDLKCSASQSSPYRLEIFLPVIGRTPSF